MSEGAVPECLSCGSCCFSTRPDYVSVRGSDHSRLGELAESLTEFIGNRCYMRMHEGHCAALELELDTQRYVCSIYEQRPAVCRELLRASPACTAELHAKRDRPPRLLAVLTRAAARPESVRTRR